MHRATWLQRFNQYAVRRCMPTSPEFLLPPSILQLPVLLAATAAVAAPLLEEVGWLPPSHRKQAGPETPAHGRGAVPKLVRMQQRRLQRCRAVA